MYWGIYKRFEPRRGLDRHSALPGITPALFLRARARGVDRGGRLGWRSARLELGGAAQALLGARGRGAALLLLLARALQDVALDVEERVDDLVLHELGLYQSKQHDGQRVRAPAAHRAVER